jgi:hypothetical protein
MSLAEHSNAVGVRWQSVRHQDDGPPCEPRGQLSLQRFEFGTRDSDHLGCFDAQARLPPLSTVAAKSEGETTRSRALHDARLAGHRVPVACPQGRPTTGARGHLWATGKAADLHDGRSKPLIDLIKFET